MELKVTQEKVVAAAARCPDAKHVLTALFPEAFKPVASDEIVLTPGGTFITGSIPGSSYVGRLIELRVGFGNNYHHKAFYLDNSYQWKLVRDSANALVLVPSLKTKV